MNKSGLADSPFFKKVEQPAPLPIKPKEKKKVRKVVRRPQKNNIVIPRHRDTMQPSNHGITVSRYDDTIVEIVRKAVKELGKEAATHRFTEDEKKAVIDIVYAYKRQGVRTSENEITRIAINFLIQDYKENGENSILHQALKALKG